MSVLGEALVTLRGTCGFTQAELADLRHRLSRPGPPLPHPPLTHLTIACLATGLGLEADLAGPTAAMMSVRMAAGGVNRIP